VSRNEEAERCVLHERERATHTGPIVDPHGQSLRTANSCIGTPALLPNSLAKNPVIPLVA
jgi:hypothetical protein